MSAIEQLREQLLDTAFDSQQINHINALCDLADAGTFSLSQEREKGRYHSPNRAEQYCLDCGAEWPCSYELIRRAHERLDQDELSDVPSNWMTITLRMPNSLFVQLKEKAQLDDELLNETILEAISTYIETEADAGR